MHSGITLLFTFAYIIQSFFISSSAMSGNVGFFPLAAYCIIILLTSVSRSVLYVAISCASAVSVLVSIKLLSPVSPFITIPANITSTIIVTTRLISVIPFFGIF